MAIMKPHQKAIYAASVIFPLCGRYAAMRYAEKNGIVGLYRLARQLEAGNYGTTVGCPRERIYGNIP